MIQVVKIGGNVIDDSEALERFLAKFAALQGPKMLIHGGGKLATRLKGHGKSGRALTRVGVAAVEEGIGVELGKTSGESNVFKRDAVLEHASALYYGHPLCRVGISFLS